MYIEQGPGRGEKVFLTILAVVFISFLISVPFMWHDKQQRLEKAWRDEGCQMYDNEMVSNVPAKCQTYFVDHYKGQNQRVQPPEEK